MPAGCGLPASGCGASAVPARNRSLDSLEQKLQLFLDRRSEQTPSEQDVVDPAGAPPLHWKGRRPKELPSFDQPGESPGMRASPIRDVLTSYQKSPMPTKYTLAFALRSKGTRGPIVKVGLVGTRPAAEVIIPPSVIDGVSYRGEIGFVFIPSADREGALRGIVTEIARAWNRPETEVFQAVARVGMPTREQDWQTVSDWAPLSGPAGLPMMLPNAFVPSERLGMVMPAGASAEAQPEVAAAIREMRAALAARQARGRELIPDGIPDLFRTVADKSAWLAARPGLSGDALAFYNETPVCDVPSSFRTEAERVAFAEQLKSASTDATVPGACVLAMIDATVSPAPSNPPMPQPDVQASPPRATPAASWRELTGGIQAVNASVGYRPPVLMSSPSDDQRSQQRTDAPVPTGVIVGSAVGAVVAIGVGAGAAVMVTRK